VTIQERIVRRKIGVFELLIGAFPIELLLGSSARAIVLGMLAAGFYFAKKEFGGEFSLLNVFELFTTPKKEGESQQ
jgi:hypothetical protein